MPDVYKRQGLFTNNLDTYTDVETTDEPVIEVKSGTLELRGGEYTEMCIRDR